MTHSDWEPLVHECLDLAERGRGLVEPNPMVGALVLRDGAVCGRGWHGRLGGPHAEVAALAEAGAAARGATLLVSLEPCCTEGRTPACTQAIVAAGIAKVVVAAVDPNPRHGGLGLKRLREAGLDVEMLEGPAANRARRMIEPFAKYITGRLPFVVAKWAQTLDGRLATHAGHSQWITSKEARARAHEERARADGILVGIGTVIADDPALTTRLAEGPSPRRFVLDPHGKIPLEARVFEPETGGVTVIVREDLKASRRRALAARGAWLMELPPRDELDLADVLAGIRAAGIGRLMVEGGPRLLGRLLGQRLADRVLVHMAPKLLLDGQGRTLDAVRPVPTMDQALLLHEVTWAPAGPDMILSAVLEKSCY